MELFGHPGLDSGATGHGATVMALAHASREVRRVCLALDQGTLAFRPGQYVLLSTGGLAPRPYAIASLSNDPLLELHIHYRPGGMGAHAASGLRVGDRAIVWGPLGTPFPLEGDAPIVAVAEGVGLSTVGGAVLAALSASPERSVALYVGARTASELYDEQLLHWLAGRCSRFSLAICVRDGGVPGSHRRMTAAAALAADRRDLRDAVVIAAGSEAMIATVVSVALARGVHPTRIATMPFSPWSAPAPRAPRRWFGGTWRPPVAPAGLAAGTFGAD